MLWRAWMLDCWCFKFYLTRNVLLVLLSRYFLDNKLSYLLLLLILLFRLLNLFLLYLLLLRYWLYLLLLLLLGFCLFNLNLFLFHLLLILTDSILYLLTSIHVLPILYSVLVFLLLSIHYLPELGPILIHLSIHLLIHNSILINLSISVLPILAHLSIVSILVVLLLIFHLFLPRPYSLFDCFIYIEVPSSLLFDLHYCHVYLVMHYEQCHWFLKICQISKGIAAFMNYMVLLQIGVSLRIEGVLKDHVRKLLEDMVRGEVRPELIKVQLNALEVGKV